MQEWLDQNHCWRFDLSCGIRRSPGWSAAVFGKHQGWGEAQGSGESRRRTRWCGCFYQSLNLLACQGWLTRIPGTLTSAPMTEDLDLLWQGSRRKLLSAGLESLNCTAFQCLTESTFRKIAALLVRLLIKVFRVHHCDGFDACILSKWSTRSAASAVSCL